MQSVQNHNVSQVDSCFSGILASSEVALVLFLLIFFFFKVYINLDVLTVACWAVKTDDYVGFFPMALFLLLS